MIIKRKKNTEQTIQTNTKPQNTPMEEVEEEFNFEDIDFSQRQERRRGDRRRGYRRIDDRNLVSRAQEEAISIREESVKEGYQVGLEKAQQDISLIKQELKKFMGLKDEVVKEISRDILDISVDIARKIIKKEVAQDHSALLEVVQDVLGNIQKNESRVTLKVAPEDVEVLEASVDEILSNSGIDAKLLVRADKSVESGGVIVETSNGIVDATFETQLSIIKEAFKTI